MAWALISIKVLASLLHEFFEHLGWRNRFHGKMDGFSML
jgi:hypothetical protein